MSYHKHEFLFNGLSEASQRHIRIYQNGDFDYGKMLYILPTWTLADLLRAGSFRLGLSPKADRIYSADGIRVDDCIMIEDNAILFFSQGEEFVHPSVSATEDLSQSDIPSNIGAYKVGHFIGRGGFGEVRFGEHEVTGEQVALKFLKKSGMSNMGAVERTTTEIQCLTAMNHSNVIRLIQHLESQKHVVLVFELMEGGDLLSFLCQSDRKSLDEDEARKVFLQVLSGVAYAHNQHICHRDLKLENILLKGQGINNIKIADFGLSEFYRPGAVLKTNCGSLSYLAPEVFLGTSQSGPPLDVWSLGVILFTLLCGRLPFENGELKAGGRHRIENGIKSRIIRCQYKMSEDLSPEAKDLIRRMMKVDVAERSSVAEIFNHCWLRSIQPSRIVVQTLPPANTNNNMDESPSHTAVINQTKKKDDDDDVVRSSIEISSPVRDDVIMTNLNSDSARSVQTLPPRTSILMLPISSNTDETAPLVAMKLMPLRLRKIQSEFQIVTQTNNATDSDHHYHHQLSCEMKLNDNDSRPSINSADNKRRNLSSDHTDDDSYRPKFVNFLKRNSPSSSPHRHDSARDSSIVRGVAQEIISSSSSSTSSGSRRASTAVRNNRYSTPSLPSCLNNQNGIKHSSSSSVPRNPHISTVRLSDSHLDGISKHVDSSLIDKNKNTMGSSISPQKTYDDGNHSSHGPVIRSRLHWYKNDDDGGSGKNR